MSDTPDVARPAGRARIEPPDLSEKGGLKDGEPQRSDERTFMQLLAFGECVDPLAVAAHVADAAEAVVVYQDLNDPLGIAVLSVSRDPNVFIDRVRPRLSSGPMAGLQLKPQYSMFGRSYSLGYEPDLREVLIERPRRTVTNPDWPWAVWYPLRRSGGFAQLPADQQRTILAEHGQIGMAFGAGDLAHDVRLACHGLDRDDNDFVIGLIGKDLFPLSAVVQAMRRTQQTSLYLDRLGPFFVGRAVRV
ncbi:MAG: chlorite dismutase family protein [Acidobacteriota bacterium]